MHGGRIRRRAAALGPFRGRSEALGPAVRVTVTSQPPQSAESSLRLQPAALGAALPRLPRALRCRRRRCRRCLCGRGGRGGAGASDVRAVAHATPRHGGNGQWAWAMFKSTRVLADASRDKTCCQRGTAGGTENN